MGMCKSGIKDIKNILKTGGNVKESRSMRNFVTLLSVCNSVVCDYDPHTNEIRY
jgi:hypothetical protein